MNNIDRAKSNIIDMWRSLSSTRVKTFVMDSYFVINCKYMSDPLFNYAIELSKDHSYFDRVNKYYQHYRKSYLQWCSQPKSKDLYTNLLGMELDLNFYKKNYQYQCPIPNIVTVKTYQDLEKWIKPLQEAFQLSKRDAAEFTKILENTMNDSAFIHYSYVINHEVVASLTLYHAGVISGVYNGATKKQYQCQGIMSKLLYAAIGDACLKKQKYMVAQAGKQSRGILSRIGFETKAQYSIYSGSNDIQVASKNWAVNHAR